ncbi:MULTISPECIES: hypothetical protein [Paenibacillus]|uniref:Uncharacterized protein n=1 Tax=Paenibacillus naphthalenovorans TaxID=162209 RepID=A0A0U2VUF7_9BACL|nr:MULTISPECIES: hypothetical protein [Paenibacillus]ALS24326.1 hypothetical protein IJ22_40160 [Paenibacillus naphthalenovorans]NTZ20428.1 hypothetical protein [Paenibacillus sp. JMULE4]GCL73782.1 hypothetical protein PN4B1_37240 [Paenibacillus naphthalenovorans]SDI53992.1 hypothetical protein SAMN05421868_107176 [Paenibacillus naphthalenovorans]
MTKDQCEICSKLIVGEPVIHVAGFPERDHTFCSALCRDRFLRMEDDECGFGEPLQKANNNRKDGK